MGRKREFNALVEMWNIVTNSIHISFQAEMCRDSKDACRALTNPKSDSETGLKMPRTTESTGGKYRTRSRNGSERNIKNTGKIYSRTITGKYS